jgi:hypothetical protein
MLYRVMENYSVSYLVTAEDEVLAEAIVTQYVLEESGDPSNKITGITRLQGNIMIPISFDGLPKPLHHTYDEWAEIYAGMGTHIIGCSEW